MKFSANPNVVFLKQFAPRFIVILLLGPAIGVGLHYAVYHGDKNTDDNESFNNPLCGADIHINQSQRFVSDSQYRIYSTCYTRFTFPDLTSRNSFNLSMNVSKTNPYSITLYDVAGLIANGTTSSNFSGKITGSFLLFDFRIHKNWTSDDKWTLSLSAASEAESKSTAVFGSKFVSLSEIGSQEAVNYEFDANFGDSADGFIYSAASVSDEDYSSNVFVTAVTQTKSVFNNSVYGACQYDAFHFLKPFENGPYTAVQLDNANIENTDSDHTKLYLTSSLRSSARVLVVFMNPSSEQILPLSENDGSVILTVIGVNCTIVDLQYSSFLRISVVNGGIREFGIASSYILKDENTGEMTRVPMYSSTFTIFFPNLSYLGQIQIKCP